MGTPLSIASIIFSVNPSIRRLFITTYLPFIATPTFTILGEAANTEGVGAKIKIPIRIKALSSFIFEIINCFKESFLQGNARFPTKIFQ